MPYVIVHVPEEQPHRIEITDTVVIGRVPPADVVISDAKVSRTHCRLSKSRAGWSVTDLGSSNGTRVGGVRVKARVLADGDRLELGRSVVEFHADPPKAATAPVRRSARERLRSPRRRR